MAQSNVRLFFKSPLRQDIRAFITRAEGWATWYAPHKFFTSDPRLDLGRNVVLRVWIIDGIVPPGEALAEIPRLRRRDVGATDLGPAVEECTSCCRNRLLLIYRLRKKGLGLGERSIDGTAGDAVIFYVEEACVLGSFANGGGESFASGEIAVDSGEVDDGNFRWVAVPWWCFEDIAVDGPVSAPQLQLVCVCG